MARAITLVSGGLDSSLALAFMASLGVDQVALHGTNVFATDRTDPHDPTGVPRLCKQLGVPLHLVDISDQLIALVKNPDHGHGKNLNPCIDCRMNMLRRAAALMDRLDAQFIVTGEVVGQRPMSQNRTAMDLVESRTGLHGLLLRPLSAKNLEPTIPEQEGWVDRDALLDFSGRTRKPQMALASKLGITDFASPAGGCLLTDPGFCKRLGELMDHKPDFTRDDVDLIKVGRHFRLDESTRLVVGRNLGENRQIEQLAKAGDMLFAPVGVPGPTGLLRGNTSVDNQCFAVELTARYITKAEDETPVTFELSCPGKRKPREYMEVLLSTPDYCDEMRV